MNNVSKMVRLLSCACVFGLASIAYAQENSAPISTAQPREESMLKLPFLTEKPLRQHIAEGIERIRLPVNGKLGDDASWAVPHALRVAAKPSGNMALPLEFVVETSKRGFTLRAKMPQDLHIYAMGDKTGGLDRRGGTFVNWNSDAYGFQAYDDPIYKSIPFFIGVNDKGEAFGFFLDNSSRVSFDFGHKDADTLEISAPSGSIDYYMISGPTLKDVVRRYTLLTGRPDLPPKWALGYQQSRYSYMSEQEIRDVVARYKKENFPLDVMWMDIDYLQNYRPFMINTKTFPDVKGLAHDMNTQGVKLVSIVDLHVANLPNAHYRPYDEGVAGDHFVKAGNGKTYSAPVWPGASVFPEFTQAKTRQWYGTLYNYYTDLGIAGIWNDMNEPAIFETPTKTMPLDVQHRIASDDFSKRTATHDEIHNVYGMLNSRATYDGLKTLRPDERPFVMTRASYAGGQRYAVTWTGDNTASWEHLKLGTNQLMNLGLSGFAYAGTDVGGFTGRGPSPELMTRWFQYATFSPIFRDHSDTHSPHAEPWLQGAEHLAIRKKFVVERYRLMPTIYALAEENSRTGDPLMRPVNYDYPKMPAQCGDAQSFTLGANILILVDAKPEGPHDYEGCLPAGGWYDYWSGKRVAGKLDSSGKYESIMLSHKIESIPVFVRAGAVLVKAPLTQSTAQTPQGALELHVYAGGVGVGHIYEDDGHSMGYTRGAYLRQSITQEADGSLVFSAREGTYTPWWNSIEIIRYGADGKISRQTIADHPLAGKVGAAMIGQAK
jgi:alpha-glucosidase